MALTPPKSKVVDGVSKSSIDASSTWLEAYAAKLTLTASLSARIARAALKEAIKDKPDMDLVRKSLYELGRLGHNSTVTGTRLCTQELIRRRIQVLESSKMREDDKVRLTYLPVGGSDLFGPHAAQVRE